MNWGISVLIVSLIVGNAMSKPKTDIWSDDFNKQLRKSIDAAHEISYLERLRNDKQFRLWGDGKEAKEMAKKAKKETPEEYAVEVAAKKLGAGKTIYGPGKNDEERRHVARRKERSKEHMENVSSTMFGPGHGKKATSDRNTIAPWEAFAFGVKSLKDEYNQDLIDYARGRARQKAKKRVIEGSADARMKREAMEDYERGNDKHEGTLKARAEVKARMNAERRKRGLKESK